VLKGVAAGRRAARAATSAGEPSAQAASGAGSGR
jgi:hypothetical protein